MKKRLQGMVIGFFAAMLLAGTIVTAATGESTVEIFYNNIKVYVDGALITPKDANGKVLEPFTMNGTTYLPLRAIGEALGKEVTWDGATQSVYLGKKGTGQNQPDNYLDKIQYSDFVKGGKREHISVISGKITDHLNNDYTNGILFYSEWGSATNIEGDGDEVHSLVDYPLNSQYRKLTGKIVLPKSVDIKGVDKIHDANSDKQTCTVFFYADGQLIKQVNEVTASMPFNFDIDITGTNKLTIKLKNGGAHYEARCVALTDLALYK